MGRFKQRNRKNNNRKQGGRNILNMKKSLKIIFYIFIFISVFALPLNKILAQNASAGFVPSNIWYSKDNFTEGDKIKIYTLLFNQDLREFSGEIAFYNKELLLGKKNFILKSQESEVVAVEWIVTAGNHTIYAKIENPKFLIGEGKYEEATITQNQSEKSQKIVIKKITPDISKIENDIKTTTKDILDPVKDIQEQIIENTPEAIAKPAIALASNIDNLRLSGLDYATNRKEEIKEQIAKYNNQEVVNEGKDEFQAESSTSVKKSEDKNGIYKPVKYLSLFFFTVASFILNNKIIFYLTLILIVFYTVRFIWRKFA
jgi:hypothetical protein